MFYLTNKKKLKIYNQKNKKLNKKLKKITEKKPLKNIKIHDKHYFIKQTNNKIYLYISTETMKSLFE